jgi:fructose-bisphosphate aldolase, class II
MTLSNLKSWIREAQRKQFAIGAFNANTMEQVQAIVLAAEAEQAPVIIQVSHHALEYAGNGNPTLGLRYMAEIGKVAAESVSVPVALHLDHGTESEVMQAIALGFTSVMFDGGELTFEENVATTRRLREAANATGVNIEAELGAVPRADRSEHFDHENLLTAPEDAAVFARETGIDTFAIAIGSVHAIRSKHIRLDLERLKAIHAVVSIPLVLHGSSGVLDADITASIGLGICKVNAATQLTQIFTGAVRYYLAGDTGEVDPRKYLGPAREAMKEQVRERIRFLGLTGKAAESAVGM